jgi:hypothetical protein
MAIAYRTVLDSEEALVTSLYTYVLATRSKGDEKVDTQPVFLIPWSFVK